MSASVSLIFPATLQPIHLLLRQRPALENLLLQLLLMRWYDLSSYILHIGMTFFFFSSILVRGIRATIRHTPSLPVLSDSRAALLALTG